MALRAKYRNQQGARASSHARQVRSRVQMDVEVMPPDHSEMPHVCHTSLMLNARGIALMSLGRMREALQCFDRALSFEPNFADALNNRGNALRTLGGLSEALNCYEQALVLAPDFIAALNNKGNVLRDLRRPRQALAVYTRAIALQPFVAESFNNRGGALMDLKRFDEALADYDHAIVLRPHYLDAICNRAGVLLELKRAKEAIDCCERVLDLDPKFAEALVVRANALRDLDRCEEALASYDTALALNPAHAPALENKGITLGSFGRFGEAVDALESAIGLMPKRARFYYHLALCKRFIRDDPQIEVMRKLAQDLTSLDSDAQVFLLFALAKAYADIDEHELSFRHLIVGNALKHAQISYDVSADLKLFDRTKAVFNRALLRKNEACGERSSLPVFVLGMPRSGTTLVEQILASHPKVFGAGEVDDFSSSLAEMSGDAWPECVSHMSQEQFHDLGARYICRIREHAPAAERIVDKMMMNFRFAGLIHLALPNARIIHVRRDPIDTCVSCFSVLFQKGLNFTYHLEELGRYYRAYAALMAHWRDVLPPETMLEVQYEKLVGDLEGQARRIIAHCDLEWDARCLDFHRTQRLVRTASVEQVRRPVYKTSVGRWRPYESFLGPLIGELEQL